MESAFGIDHGEVSKALNPFKAFQASRAAKVPPAKTESLPMPSFLQGGHAGAMRSTQTAAPAQKFGALRQSQADANKLNTPPRPRKKNTAYVGRGSMSPRNDFR